MASVPTSEFPGKTPADYSDALDHLSQLTAGNSNINTHPGLMQALHGANASPQQAQAVDQYMAGVKAQNMYTLARINGGTINFTQDERTAMDHMHFDYSAVDAQAKAVADASTNGLGVAVGTSSSPAAPQSAPPAEKAHTGFFSGGVMHVLGHAGHDLLHNPVMNTIGEGLNIAQASLAGSLSDVQSVEQHLGITSDLLPGNAGVLLPKADEKYGAALHAQRAAEMQALGYDPNSVWSGLAFDSHGYSKSDVTPALKAWDDASGEQKWGMDGMTVLEKGIQFLKDPAKVRDGIIADQSLSAEDAAKQLEMLSSPEFSQFAKRLSADDWTFGHQFAKASGLDPIEHPLAFNATAATTDLITSLAIDPTLAVGKLTGAVLKVPSSIASLQDSERIVSLLDPANVGISISRKRVINGWQSMIDSTNTIREGINSGDHAAVAGAYASIKTKTPNLLPLVSEFIGESQGKLRTGLDDLGIGITSDVLKTVKGEPVTNLAEAARYVTEQGGLQRLMVAGKAPVEASYMPGAVSNWGLKAIRANIAAHAASKDVVRTAEQSAQWLAARNAGTLSTADHAVFEKAAAKADPATVEHASIDPKKIERILPGADDAVDVKSGAIIASPDPSIIGQKADELASALRAAKTKAPTSGTWGDTLLPAEQGQIAFNIRRYGQATQPESALGKVGGWASPTAIAARYRLAKTRWSSLLPINNTFSLADASSADKVRQYARFYLGKGQSNVLASQFAAGDLGTRKTIVQGLFDQVAHAAGLPRTTVGQKMLERFGNQAEAYTHVGPGWIVQGKQVALHKAQTTDSLTLLSFKQISDASARVGLYEATVGKLATSTAADHLFNIFRVGILLRPATATRNIIEPYAKAILDGQFGMVMRARALTYSSSDEMASIGRKLGVTSVTGEIPEEVRQMAYANLAEATKSGSKHSVAIAQHVLNRIEKGDISMMAGYGRTRPGAKLSDLFAHVTRFYHSQLLQSMPEAELKHFDELYSVLPNMSHNFGQQVVAESFSPRGANDIRDISEAGLGAGEVKYNLTAGEHPLLAKEAASGHAKATRTGFNLQSTDSTTGSARYINALHQRTYGAPATARAAVEVLRSDDGELAPLIEALDKETQHSTIYGQYYKPDETGKAIRALTPEEVALGKRQWAQDVVNDYRWMLQGQDGTLNEAIADHIAATGEAPGVKFLDDMPKSALPARVLAPEYTAMPLGGVNALAQTLQDVSGKAFNQIVEGTIKRQSSMPFLAAHYLKVRAEQDASGLTDRLVEAGLSPESAIEVQKGQAVRSAYIRTAQMIDDPGQKTQFDTVARNLLMFPRAMEAFIRRWGGSLASDPFKARKMMLALEATEHSGLIYRDQNGEQTFTYPGSEVMRDVMIAVSKIPGFSGIAKFPVGMDMTGKVMLAAPGFNAPLRFSMSPMINIPMRAIFSLMPEHESTWIEIDTALNGAVGASQAHQGALQSVLPSSLNKLLAAGSSDERNSIFASSMAGAIAHLSAAGLAPDPSDPPAVQDRFLNQVKTQVRNQLYLRFAFGLVAPAAPSGLNENVDNSSAKGQGSGTASDYAFSLSGIKNLSDEYKNILDKTNGDVARASQIFTALHPEGLAYTVPTTGTVVNKAYLPATTASLNWMEGNLPFLDKYKSVGAYFLPKEPGAFDSNAYQAQLALRLRQKKDISTYYNDVQVALGSQQYYKEYDQYKQMRAEAIASGDKARVSLLSQTFSQWKSDYLDRNQPLKMKFADTSQNIVNGENQIADLQLMVKNGDVPDGLGPQVKGMVDLFTQYNTWRKQVPSTAVGTAQKQAMATAIDEQLGTVAATDPRLANLFNAVFRSVDSSLTKIG